MSEKDEEMKPKYRAWPSSYLRLLCRSGLKKSWTMLWVVQDTGTRQKRPASRKRAPPVVAITALAGVSLAKNIFPIVSRSSLHCSIVLFL